MAAGTPRNRRRGSLMINGSCYGDEIVGIDRWSALTADLSLTLKLGGKFLRGDVDQVRGGHF